jgi:hypothetical protein
LILASAILITFKRWGDCKPKEGRLVAILWAILYSSCTITFFVLTLYTLSTVGSVAGSDDMSKIIYASGTELQIRVASSFIYGLSEIIYAFTHKSEAQRIAIAEQTIADQLLALTQNAQTITRLQDEIRSEQDQRTQAATRHNQEVTHLLQKHVNEQAELTQQINLLTGRLEELQAQKAQRSATKKNFQVLESGTDDTTATQQTPEAAYLVGSIFRKGQTTYTVDLGDKTIILHTLLYAAGIWGLGSNDTGKNRLRRYCEEHPEVWAQGQDGNSTNFVLDSAKSAVQAHYHIKEEKTRKKAEAVS